MSRTNRDVDSLYMAVKVAPSVGAFFNVWPRDLVALIPPRPSRGLCLTFFEDFGEVALPQCPRDCRSYMQRPGMENGCHCTLRHLVGATVH
mmetsp:Transcript_31739/g.51043  ORF Transcript_31739/g.51043 Transcript_31739/m.51043 type:complete len:91 (+) Transcript_31739:605-877(+)